MSSPSYVPLEACTSVHTSRPPDRYDNVANEAKHYGRATYSAISGSSYFSIPRKAIGSGNSRTKVSPLPLSRPWYLTLINGILDIILCLGPLTFFTLGWCAYRLDGKGLSDWGTAVQQWSLLAPTIFPILFAAVVARSTHSMANFLLERGVSLITLEQLIRSNSIFNALTTQVGLHSVTILGVSLVLLWVLSPARGQASLRLLSITTSDINSTTFVSYTSDAGSMLFDDLQTSLVYGQVDGVYTATLLGSPEIKASPRDVWGNVKIPDMAYLNSSAADGDGWLPVPDGPVNYSSLLGNPVAGLPTTGSSSFILNSNYYKIQCHKLWHIAINASEPDAEDWYTQLGLSSFNSYLNATTIFAPVAQSWASTHTSFFIGRYMANGSEFVSSTRFPSIFLGSQYSADDANTSPGMSFANCTMEPIFVDCRVSCTGRKCAVTNMRLAQAPDKDSGYWQSDLMNGYNTEYFDMFSQELAFALPGDYYYNLHSTPTEIYISGQESYPYSSPALANQVKLYEVPIEDLSRRFTIIVNTYWSASGGLGSFWTGIFSTSSIDSLGCTSKNCTTAQVTHSHEIYKSHVWWVIILLVASIVLFGLAVAGMVLKWMSRGPDLLGYASSLVRENPHVMADAAGSAVDGLDYTRKLAELRIQLLDVRPDDKYGHIAVASEMIEHGGSGARLLKGRLYI